MWRKKATTTYSINQKANQRVVAEVIEPGLIYPLLCEQRNLWLRRRRNTRHGHGTKVKLLVGGSCIGDGVKVNQGTIVKKLIQQGNFCQTATSARAIYLQDYAEAAVY